METKSPSSAARSTPVRVPKRARKILKLGVDVLVGHLDGSTSILSASRSGMAISDGYDLGGEDEFLVVFELVISISGWPSGRTSVW